MTILMTQVTQEGGNTQPPLVKKDIKGRKWCFTLNNYNDTETQEIKEYLHKNAKLWIFGYEVGSKGTPHLQGYFEFENAKKASTIKKNMNSRMYFTKAKGNLEQNYDYTSKDGKFEYDGFEPNELKWTQKIEKFYDWEKDIIKVLDSNPDDRSLHWYWETKGCAGKTTFQKWVFCNYEKVIVLSGKAADMKNGIIEYKKTNGFLPKIVLINVPRTNADYLSYCGLEEIKDMFFYSGKYEGGMVCGPSPHVLLFANSEPDYEKVSLDRWKVTNLNSTACAL